MANIHLIFAYSRNENLLRAGLYIYMRGFYFLFSKIRWCPLIEQSLAKIDVRLMSQLLTGLIFPPIMRTSYMKCILGDVSFLIIWYNVIKKWHMLFFY